jgi:hypothetical protein
MRRTALMIAGMLYATCALASPPPLYPPAQYDKPYTAGVMETHTLTLPEIQKRCAKAGFGHGRLACTIVRSQGRCSVYLPRVGERGLYEGTTPVVITSALQAGLRRHERGHCNGWPADHPMGGR